MRAKLTNKEQRKTAVEAQGNPPGRLRRAVNDLVMAEMFLIQATLESASAIGDGVNDLIEKDEFSDESVPETLQRIRDEALEPYTSRFQYLRELMNRD